ncbi:MAG TPA: branched-chain amino acid ABC transporter permease [Acidimicrobiia bacterium]|nr:branched-chain amino acid ABC transporter permease [Acidimicrobiia bacterium]
MIRRFLTIAALAGALISSVALQAAAGEAEGGTAIRGTLENIDGAIREPVEGVTITVSQDGTVIGSAVSDESGDWRVPVPAPGVYQVELDVGTLPEGVALTDPDRYLLPEVDVSSGQDKVVRFNLGPGLSGTVGRWQRVWGLFLIGLKLGAIIALSSIGLSLVFGVTGLVNFAHGDLVTLGAMLAFFFSTSPVGPGWPLLLAIIPALVISGIFGGAQEAWLWRPLRRRKSGLVSLIVISIGLSFVIRYAILVVFSGLPKPYAQFAVQTPIDFLGAPVVPKTLVVIVVAAVTLALVGLFFVRTQMGTAMRAVSDNGDLAEASGIDVNRVIMVTWVLGAALAAFGGILLGASEQVQWDMGFKILLLIFSAVILGGLGTAFGAMIGGFAIGVAVEMSTLVVPVEFKTAVALGILVVMLLFRPQGLLGTAERVG